MKKVTLWYKYNKDKEGKISFPYNHLENSWNLNAYPTPVSKEQENMWKNNIWLKEFGYLINDVVRKVKLKN